MIHILFFGQLADMATNELGKSEFDFTLPVQPPSNITLNELRRIISKDSTLLADELKKSSNLCAVNQRICHTDTLLNDGDEVAFMSPLSGG
ncbi:MAG: MoaD/ThiS family protein [Arenicella sp.]